MRGRIKEGCWVITKISLGDNLVITQWLQKIKIGVIRWRSLFGNQMQIE